MTLKRKIIYKCWILKVNTQQFQDILRCFKCCFPILGACSFFCTFCPRNKDIGVGKFDDVPTATNFLLMQTLCGFCGSQMGERSNQGFDLAPWIAAMKCYDYAILWYTMTMTANWDGIVLAVDAECCDMLRPFCSMFLIACNRGSIKNHIGSTEGQPTMQVISLAIHQYTLMVTGCEICQRRLNLSGGISSLKWVTAANCCNKNGSLRIRYQLHHADGLHRPHILPHSLDLPTPRQLDIFIIQLIFRGTWFPISRPLTIKCFTPMWHTCSAPLGMPGSLTLMLLGWAEAAPDSDISQWHSKKGQHFSDPKNSMSCAAANAILNRCSFHI